MAMRGFEMVATSSTWYRIGVKSAPQMTVPFARNEIISRGPGPMKPWTDIRDLPAPKKNSFREWFKKHRKEGQS